MVRKINIEIVSDTICPWCFVGKRRLEKAIALHRTTHPDTSFNISWHPFYLDPTVKATEDKRVRYERKFGKAQFEQMIPHMEAVGRREGIAFKYGGKIGNTRDSHRLIAEAGAGGEDLQDRLVNALFHAYFEVNDDISDTGTFARIAKEVGLFGSEEEGLEFLKSERRGAEVDKEVDFNQYRRGIIGQAEVSGAQEPHHFERIFHQVEKFKEKDIADEEICLPDGLNC